VKFNQDFPQKYFRDTGHGKDRVSCEVNSIGATGARPPLHARTNICIGTRIFSIVDGQMQKEKMGKLLEVQRRR